MFYEKEFETLVTIFKIQNYGYYFYISNIQTIVRYNTLISDKFESVLIFKNNQILDFNIIDYHLYVLSSIGIHYFDLNRLKNKFVEDINLSLIFRTKNTFKIINIDSDQLIFNIGNKMIFSIFKFKKIKIKKKLIDQSKNLLLINKVIDLDDINAFTFSKKLNKLLILDDLVVVTQDNKKLFHVENRFKICIMINNYYIYSIDSKIRIRRKNKSDWTEEYEIEVDNGYIVKQLESREGFIYVLACNYQKMECRIYTSRIKNIFI